MTLLNNRYELRERIGQGGMASVWSAFDRRVKKLVAIKFLRVSLRDPMTQRKFASERELLAKLEHDNIVNITDSGVDAEGSPFYVMKLLRGHDLHIELRDGPIPWRRAVTIASQVARALHAAHELKIIHRDIKPGNIFLVRDKRKVVVRLLDFGVATVRDAERHEESLTPAGCAVGTVHYIPPELVTGEPATEQSDIYSLGVTLYKMVTGTLPFSSDAVGPARDHRIMQLHVQQEPVSPRTRNAEIPPQLDAIILRCMQKEPGKRFHSADLLVDELEDLLAGDIGKQTLQFSRRPSGVGVVPPRKPKAAAQPPRPRATSVPPPPVPRPTKTPSHAVAAPKGAWQSPLKKSASTLNLEETPRDGHGEDTRLGTSQDIDDGSSLEAMARVAFRTTVAFTTFSVFVSACMFFTITPVTSAWAAAIVGALRQQRPPPPPPPPPDEEFRTVIEGDPEEPQPTPDPKPEPVAKAPVDTEPTDEVPETGGEPQVGTTGPEVVEPPPEPDPKKELYRRIRRMRTCRGLLPFKNMHTVRVQVEFSKSGRVTGATVTGTDGPADSCIEKKLMKMRLRKSAPPEGGKITDLEVKI